MANLQVTPDESGYVSDKSPIFLSDLPLRKQKNIQVINVEEKHHSTDDAVHYSEIMHEEATAADTARSQPSSRVLSSTPRCRPGKLQVHKELHSKLSHILLPCRYKVSNSTVADSTTKDSTISCSISPVVSSPSVGGSVSLSCPNSPITVRAPFASPSESSALFSSDYFSGLSTSEVCFSLCSSASPSQNDSSPHASVSMDRKCYNLYSKQLPIIGGKPSQYILQENLECLEKHNICLDKEIFENSPRNIWKDENNISLFSSVTPSIESVTALSAYCSGSIIDNCVSANSSRAPPMTTKLDIKVNECNSKNNSMLDKEKNDYAILKSNPSLNRRTASLSAASFHSISAVSSRSISLPDLSPEKIGCDITEELLLPRVSGYGSLTAYVARSRTTNGRLSANYARRFLCFDDINDEYEIQAESWYQNGKNSSFSMLPSKNTSSVNCKKNGCGGDSSFILSNILNDKSQISDTSSLCAVNENSQFCNGTNLQIPIPSIVNISNGKNKLAQSAKKNNAGSFPLPNNPVMKAGKTRFPSNSAQERKTCHHLQLRPSKSCAPQSDSVLQLIMEDAPYLIPRVLSFLPPE